MDDEYLFRAKCHNAYLFKILSEILQTNLKTSCFQIKKTGIYLRQMDVNRKTLVDVTLNAENFLSYWYPSNHSMFLGLTLNHLHKLLKTVKKKDSVGVDILKSEPTELAIQVFPKENNRVTTSFLKIQRIQNIVVDLPIGYQKSVVIPSSEFQKISKDILAIGKSVQISANDDTLEFAVDAGGILKRKVEYGNLHTQTKKKIEYVEDFDTEQIIKIAKICNLSTLIHIYCLTHLPVCISTQIGQLGKISIYIKSKKQVLADC